ncbi:hypothetical protein M3Y96_00974400 [Aphelenchoides besseyi]|nr:hypothetical protein M3Y96_00974400 [Aphelenchoides besseyi]
MFEESHLDKVLLASTSVAIGVGCFITLLILLSVLPDCRGHHATDFLTVFAIQCTVHLLLLFVNIFTLSYTLAADNSVFLSESLHNAPGYMAIFCLSSVVALQLYLSARRFINYSFPHIFPFRSDHLATRTVTFGALLFAFLFGSNRFVNCVFADRTLNYCLEGLRWMYSTQSSEENFYVFASVGFAFAFCAFLYFLSVTFALIKCARKETKKEQKLDLLKDFVWLTLSLLLDAAYCGLIVYCHFCAVPDRFLHVPVIPNFVDGCVQSFALVIFPAFSTFTTDDILRQALRWRAAKLMASGNAPMTSPSLPRRSTRSNSRGNQSALMPMFLQVDPNQKPIDWYRQSLDSQR